jgi:hypothetical protein
MSVSVRSFLMALVATIMAACVAVAPSIAPPPDVRVPANQPDAARILSKTTVELLAAVQRMSAAVASSAVPATAPNAALTAVSAPQNAASDFIVNAWNAVLPWIDYGVNLTDYVLGFIPCGYLIGDQVSIVYYSLVRPVANSFVVDLVAPVVNDPLNIFSYTNGLIALGSVTATSLINLGIDEFNYFFGWLIPPLPPLPFAATQSAPSVQLAAAGATAVDPPQKRAGLARPQGRAASDEIDATTAPATTKPTTSSTPSAPKTLQAQGGVRGTGVSTKKDTAKVSSDLKGDKGPKGEKPKAGNPKKDRTDNKTTSSGSAVGAHVAP